MWKSISIHTSDTHQDSQRSSAANKITSTLATAQPSPLSPPPPPPASSSSSSTSSSSSSCRDRGTPPTLFLASRSEIQFALASDFALQDDPPVLPSQPSPAQHEYKEDIFRHFLSPAHHNNNAPDHFLFSYGPRQIRAISPNTNNTNDDDNAIHLSPNPNECYRIRHVQLPHHTDHCSDGNSIPLRGGYVTDMFPAPPPVSPCPLPPTDDFDEDEEGDEDYDNDDDATLPSPARGFDFGIGLGLDPVFAFVKKTDQSDLLGSTAVVVRRFARGWEGLVRGVRAGAGKRAMGWV